MKPRDSGRKRKETRNDKKTKAMNTPDTIAAETTDETNSSYALGEGDRNRRYKEAYETPEAKAWRESLSKEEYRTARKLGLLGPDVPSPSGTRAPPEDGRVNVTAWNGGSAGDEDDGDGDEWQADAPPFGGTTLEASALPEIAEDAEPAPPTAKPVVDVNEVLRKLVGELLAQRNMRLSVECLGLVTGLSYDGASEQAIAQRHGITRSAVSQRCVSLCVALGLPPSRAMRPEEVRETYREVQIELAKKKQEAA